MRKQVSVSGCSWFYTGDLYYRTAVHSGWIQTARGIDIGFHPSRNPSVDRQTKVGGSWLNYDADYFRAAIRLSGAPGNRDTYIGFRIQKGGR